MPLPDSSSPPGPPPALPPRISRTLRILAGMLAGNLAGLGSIWLSQMIGRTGSEQTWMVGMIGLPVLIGLVASWIWRPLDLRIGEVFLHAFFTTLAGLAGATIVLKEGVICLIIASPLIYLFVAAGALLGRALFLRNDYQGRLCLLPLLALSLAAEPAFRSPKIRVATDEILIHARPAQVWPHVLAFPEIPDPPRYWLFRLGLPYPTSTTNGGNFVGAKRACHFSEGAVFEETIAAFEPERRLTFDIVHAPPDPELLGHLDTLRGEFQLRDNGDGTTTLIGRSWYALHVRPDWYFDWWTRDMCRAVHLRVMRHVKRLAENDAP